MMQNFVSNLQQQQAKGGANNIMPIPSMFGMGQGTFRPQAAGEANAGANPAQAQTKTSVFSYAGQRLEIRDVYRETLEQELACIRALIPKYKYVAMDTEFPGIVARPIGENNPEQQYQTLRCNVDLLKIIQLGVAFLDENGNVAPGCPCWQFNFKFSLEDDMYAQDSIELLQRSGIDFDAHNERGIDVHDFGELLISSGLVLVPNVTWITFHGGYDFGYLLKVLTCKPLPADEASFFELLRTYFPSIYDEKYMAKTSSGFTGGLNQLADELGVERIGQMHQAGSDSLLTGQVFFKMRDKLMQGKVAITENVLYGLGTDRQIIY
jgi:CCR4-NOT transcription complex subunit 7/8